MNTKDTLVPGPRVCSPHSLVWKEASGVPVKTDGEKVEDGKEEMSEILQSFKEKLWQRKINRKKEILRRLVEVEAPTDLILQNGEPLLKKLDEAGLQLPR